MKTTLELPDELMRAIKVRAAEEGITIKDLLTDLLRRALGPVKTTKKRVLKYRELPVRRGGKPATPAEELTPARVARILWGSSK